MKTKLCLLLMVAGLIGTAARAQNGTGAIKGKVLDAESGEALPFVNVTVFKDGIQKAGTTTDFNGIYHLQSLPPDTYDLHASFVGYQPVKIEHVPVHNGKTKYQDFSLYAGLMLEAVEVVHFCMPLYDRDETGISRRSKRKASKTNGAPPNNNAVLNIRGSRSEANFVFIDGIKVRGSGNLPQSSVGQMEVITGGLPASYGYTPDPGAPVPFMQLPHSVYLPQPDPQEPVVDLSEPNRYYPQESYNQIVENEFEPVFTSPLSTFSIDVDPAAYSNIRRHLSEGIRPPQDAIRLEEMVNYFTYAYPEPEGEHPIHVYTELAESPWNPGRKIALVALQAERMDVEELPPSNLVFLIDVSGSMQSADKLPLLQRSLELLVKQMQPEDHVSLVVYAGAAGVVLPPTPGTEKGAILRAIQQLEAGGSTAGGAGIELAYKLAEESFREEGNNRVILATDGDFNVGISDQSKLIRLIEEKRESGVFLSVLGYGTGNLRDGMMEQLADHGNGNYAYIDNLMEARKVLVTEMQGTLFTLAKDVKLQLEFNPKYVQSYRLIGYENRLLDDRDFEDDTKDAGEIGVGHSVTALYELIPADTQAFQASPLKYQQSVLSERGHSPEWLNVSIRYKQPDERKSRLLNQPVHASRQLEVPSEHMSFACAVAQFGLVLRDSKFKGEATYASIRQQARASMGADPNGYRAEFLRLVAMAESLQP